ncbi:lytic transglycosylase domain-containing protein [Verminephrobacter aporrectodeae]|uniref:lytic transglycosylase domain-containing protein n=1 Tax=Verminephrobacter aporrectodeae TaxID=1110389 RepID=UPI0022436D6B|nr:lytic transglycosylase domain-containing protein [Verminephrobacter aporrectodeae]MCW8175869.1 lytic transglycosylase domain-containing protein [Verminephrobacter aporrectodeae subsp. tuberculatae]MCW8203512.1 lytic transglycosylase domain-containing protein [Verminephrobacter aporrectodeae subsp. tuberculatae]
MQFSAAILTPFLASALLAGAAPLVRAQNKGDATLLEMQQAFRKGERKKLEQLLPAVRGHALEPWAAYWELRSRLEDATPQEVESFMQRYAGSYQEDRLRNDWLLLLGQRRDWGRFAEQLPHFRMSDDREVRCYALLIEHIGGRADAALAQDVRSNWYALRDADDGCTHAAGELYGAGRLSALDIWRKARLGADAGRPRVVRNALEIVAPDALAQLKELHDAPEKYLRGRGAAHGRMRQELVLLALIRLAGSDPDGAARQLDSQWSAQLSPEERNAAWGAIGKATALKLSSRAVDYFANVTRDSDLSDEQLVWKVRAALRAGRWRSVAKALDAMGPEARRDSAWVYWRALALLEGRALPALPAGKPGDAKHESARQLLQGIAGTRGFYEQLALEELGERISVPPAPAPLTAEEKAAARANPGLNRGLYAISLGLRSEGVREWNYATNLHQSGGMSDRELLAAADFACQREVWDRCINTSERTRSVVDTGQRFPMPFRNAVLGRARDIGIDPAYVYGLIRQESRFVLDARSHAGASGLMQVMPATARWTARQIGLTNFSPGQITDRDANITIGMTYLKLVLDDFSGSLPLAAAAYNAGPGRPRNWRNGPVLNTAIWIENLPFAETRDYVKKVLSNTTNYAALLTGLPQSLKSRLGNTIGPRDASAPEVNKELP